MSMLQIIISYLCVTSAKLFGTVSPRMSEKNIFCCSRPLDVEYLLKASFIRFNSAALTE